MTHVIGYAVGNIPYGCLYALMAVGLVLTFRATGVFNLAFGAQAFVAAFVYALLNSYGPKWPQWAAFVIAVLVVSPLLGLALDRFLFRHIPTASTTVKVVSSLGLLIAIPQLIPIIFGNKIRYSVPYLWLSPQTVYFSVFGFQVTGADIAAVVITVAVVGGLVALFRWSGIGLSMRAVVESRRLAQLQGVNSASVAAFAWMLSSTLAGLSGVLLLPFMQNLDPTSPLQFTTLLVAGMTAAAFASLRSMPIAFGVGLGIAVVEGVLQYYLPPTTTLGSGIQQLLPFVLLVGVLLLNRNLRTVERNSDPLAGVDPPPPPPSIAIRDHRLDVPMKWAWRLLLVAFVVSVLTWIPDYWVLPLGQGITYSIIFLSVTLITGMSGQLSLCQAAFAGLGAAVAAQLAADHGVPILVGAVVGGIVVAAVGMLVSLLVSRVSGLLLTLVTLAFAIFADTVLFQYRWTLNSQSGVNLPRPQIGSINFGQGSPGDRYFLVLCMLILAAAMYGVTFVQRGTTGRFLSAMRGSPTAASTLGINLTRSKVTVFALSAGLAALGGALYGSMQGSVTAEDFNYVYSLAFVVVVLTTGATTVEGAVQAGMGFAVITYVVTSVVPQHLPAALAIRINGMQFVLFAFGALTYAAHPEGIVEYQRTKWMKRVSRALRAWDERRPRTSGSVPSTESPPAPEGLRV
jgi:branched-chain amino acid transport system permease protein